MYIDKTPDAVNTLLKNNGGFVAGGGNFIWSKCSVLGLSQVYQSPYYADAVSSQGLTKMRSLLDEGRPLVCHIDFDPRDPDDDQHWILVMGYDENDVFWAYDPWTGTLISLDVYGGVKRAVLEYRAYDKILPKDVGVDELTECRYDRDGNHNDRMALYEELGFTGLFNRTVAVEKIRQLRELEKSFVQKDEQLKTANDNIKDLEDKLVKLQDEHLIFADASTKTIEDQGRDIKNLSTSLQELKEGVLTPVYKGWKDKLRDIIKIINMKVG